MSFCLQSRRALLLALIGGLFIITAVFAGPDDPRLSEYIRVMKKTYPDLQSMRSMIDAQLSRTKMSSGWMNPTLSVGAMNLPYPSLAFDMDPTSMLQFGLMQRIPFPGRTGYQKRIGEAKSALLQADLKVEEHEMSRMLRMAYYDLAAAEATQSILDSGVTLLQEMRTSALAMTGAAMGSSADIYAIDAETAEWSRKISDNQALIKSRKATVASYIGEPSSDSIATEPLPQVIPNLNDMVPIEQSPADYAPRIVAARKKVDESNAALELARMSYYPDIDLMLQYGYRFPIKSTSLSMDGTMITTGTLYQGPMVSMGISFPLPVWAKSNQSSEIAEMNAMNESAKHNYETARLEWKRDIETERTDFERVNQSITALRNKIIPARIKAWQASMIGYRNDQTTLMAVSEARMKLLMAKMEERMLMAENWARFGNLLERIEP